MACSLLVTAGDDTLFVGLHELCFAKSPEQEAGNSCCTTGYLNLNLFDLDAVRPNVLLVGRGMNQKTRRSRFLW